MKRFRQIARGDLSHGDFGLVRFLATVPRDQPECPQADAARLALPFAHRGGTCTLYLQVALNSQRNAVKMRNSLRWGRQPLRLSCMSGTDSSE